MKILRKSLSLLSIEKILESELTYERHNIKIIGDLDISLEDYHYLISKLKRLFYGTTNVTLLRKYRLSITTAWIFTLKYDGELNLNEMNKIIMKIPQHHFRCFLDIFYSVFEEFGFESTEIQIETMEGLIAMILENSGVLEEAGNLEGLRSIEEKKII